MFDKEVLIKAKEKAVLFIENTHKAEDIQKEILSKILQENVNTWIGRKYNFSNIKSYEDFRGALPLTVFSDYDSSIARILGEEKAVLYASENYQFVSSSGTTNNPKIIPMSMDYAKQVFIPFYITYFGQLVTHFPDFLKNASKTVNFKLDPNRALTKLKNGANHKGLSQINFGDDFKESVLFEPGSGTKWTDIPTEVEEDLERMYYRIRVSSEYEINALVGINPAVIHILKFLLKVWADRLINDIRNGTLNGEDFNTPNPALAERLSSLYSKSKELLPIDLWPDLRYVICWKEGVSQFYLKESRKVFGEKVKLMSAPLGSSEAPVAIPLFDEEDQNLLVYDTVFYEFIDVLNDQNVVLLGDLQLDRSYAVVVTQQSGFYRYITGDLVTVKGFVNGVPTVEYAGRYSPEKFISDDVFLAAIKEINGLFDIGIVNFTFQCPAEKDQNITLLIELEDEIHQELIRKIEKNIDDFLMKKSDRYCELRQNHGMSSVRIEVAERNAFFRNWISEVEKGKRPPQVKDKISEFI
ncbi:MAG: GH3 auxin-responsive promoter family protein [Bacteroidota bacterium]